MYGFHNLLECVQQQDVISLSITARKDTPNFFVDNESSAGWRVDSSARIKLGPSQMRALAHVITSLDMAELLLDHADDPASFGFDPPQSVVRIHYTNETEAALLLGYATPGGDNFYIMREGDPAVYIVDGYIGERYVFTLDNLSDKSMPSIDTGRLAYAYVNNDGYEIEVMPMLETNGAIGMTRPFPGRGVYLSIFTDSVLGNLDEIHFDELVEIAHGGELGYGLDVPWLDVRINDDENYFHLLVGSEAGDGKFYARRGYDDMIFTIDGELIKRFRDADAFSFIDRFVALIHIGTVQSITIADGDQITEAELYPGQAGTDTAQDELELSPLVDGNEVDAEEFRIWYQALVGLSYDSALDEFEPEEDTEPVFVVKYVLGGNRSHGAEIREYEYYDYNDNFYAIKDEGQWFVVNKQSVTTVRRLLAQFGNEG